MTRIDVLTRRWATMIGATAASADPDPEARTADVPAHAGGHIKRTTLAAFGAVASAKKDHDPCSAPITSPAPDQPAVHAVVSRAWERPAGAG